MVNQNNRLHLDDLLILSSVDPARFLDFGMVCHYSAQPIRFSSDRHHDVRLNRNGNYFPLTTFADLGLSQKVLSAVTDAGYTIPTPIQAGAIPPALQRRDILGIAQTGTGKTASFVLPMLTLLEKGRARARMPRTLILEPTRELAAQVAENFEKYGKNHKLNVALLIGGVSFDEQDRKLERGADVLICTPGRLLDHCERGKLLMTHIDTVHTELREAQDELRELAREPALECLAALLSPSTGIVDSHALMLSLQGDLEHAGGLVACHIGVDSLRASGAGIDVLMQDGTVLLARSVVNAAGLHACQIARNTQGLDPVHAPRAWYAKGSYFTLSGRSPFARLIYPAPDPEAHLAGLGVHLTLDLGGQAKFGPDVQWVEDPTDLQVDPRRGDAFYAEVRKYWPGLADGALQAGYAGMRPKINAPHEAAADFMIQGPAEHGVPGLVNLLGIESPGLTSSLAIADEVCARLV